MFIRPFGLSRGRMLCVAVVCLSSQVRAQWSSLPSVNNPILTDSSIYPQEVVMVSDGAGGAAFVWWSGNPERNLYAQRLDASGARQWGDNGLAVSAAPGLVNSHHIISDDAGGFFLAWQDLRTSSGATVHDAYVQRLNSAGQAQWGANGQFLRQNAVPGMFVGIDHPLMTDGTGGVYVVTFADPTFSNETPRLHRLTGAGQPVAGWTAAGVNFSEIYAIRVLAMVSDQPASVSGEHGVVLCLHTVGGGGVVRKVSADGTLGFSTGVPTGSGIYTMQAACSDGEGGAFIVTGINAEMFVFRVKADGTMAWPETDRRVVLAGGGANTEISLVPDGAGGVIVVWYGSAANNTNWRMAAQRLSATGVRLWGDNGVDVSTPTPGSSYRGSAVSDGAGGVIVQWGVATPSEVRAQRLDGNGNKLWPASGVVISQPNGLTQLVSDQASGAIYSVLVSGGNGNYNFGAKRTTLTGSLGSNSPLARLINISSRAQVGSGDDVLIPGFVVSGGDVQLLVRAIGPTLASFNVTGVLADPQLTLYNSANQIVSTNDDWGLAGNASEIATVGGQVNAFALPNGSKDSALLATLQPGLYTAVMRGVSNATGVGLVEMYEVGGATNAGRLANMSVRARVGTGDNILIPGIVVGGSDARTLLIRAVGPTLNTLFGVGGVLADPQITLFNQGGTQLAVNDNWSTPNGAQISSFGGQVGAFPLPNNSKDAAFLITLSPGVYTAQVSGVNNTTGVCLVEVYEVP